MKTFIFLSFLIVISACAKDDVQLPEDEPAIVVYPDCIIVGNSNSSNIQFTSYSPAITLDSHNSLEIHEIDMDSDGINDFQLNLYSYLPFAGTWFKGTTIKIKALHSNAEISMDPLYTDSTFFYPLQYMENDSIEQQSLWASDEFFVSLSGDDLTDLCDAPGCPMVSYGPWFGQSDKYVGVRICGTNLGWIKISFPTTNPQAKQKLLIQEYGYYVP